MSYEGDIEFICANGHYQRRGCYEPAPVKCGLHGCEEPIMWQHAIDYTNGMEEADPGTFPAPMVNVGWDDIPMEDHYGNPYFIKHLRMQPAPESAWVKAPTEEEVAAWAAEQEARDTAFREPADKYRIYSGTNLIFTSDSEAEWDAAYEGYFKDGLADLSGYPPA